VLGVVDLHRRAGRVAGAAADALALVDFQRRLAVDHGRADGRHRAAGDDRRALADVGDQIVVDLRRLGVLHVDGDVALAAAVDLAAGGGDVHAVRHVGLLRNSSMSSSIIDLTTPEASVPGMSQCSQPWVCEIIATEFWVPPTMKPASSSA
jgi:hypothetical protein